MNSRDEKKLHHLLVTSATYRLSSRASAAGLKADPENRLLWRMNPRRMEAEVVRDSLLAVAGQLDATMGGRSVPLQATPLSTRRTVYGFIDRQNLDGLFRTFDFASPDATSPRR